MFEIKGVVEPIKKVAANADDVMPVPNEKVDPTAPVAPVQHTAQVDKTAPVAETEKEEEQDK